MELLKNFKVDFAFNCHLDIIIFRHDDVYELANVF